ncbi:MAG: cation transporter [Deltaproteobacteria bacterium]|nr:cation transporter [Deltaproteobacteria bacterium]
MATDSQKFRLRAIRISIVASILILGVKIVAFWISGSVALESDAIESVVNVIASCFALYAITFADKPADEDHPYGHGKMEDFSAAFEGGLITIASLFIIYEAIRVILFPHPLHHLGLGLILNLAAGSANGFLGFFLVRTGKKYRSKAVEADGYHLLSDFYTTIGIAFGLFFVKWTGLQILDPIFALLVGILLGYTGFRIIRSSSAALLDSEDPNMISKVTGLMNRFRKPEIITVHEFRSMRTGRYTHMDVHIVVPEFYEIKKTHAIVEDFCNKIISEGKIEGEFHSHVDPCAQAYCSNCAVSPCPIRLKEFVSAPAITVQSATSKGPTEL